MYFTCPYINCYNRCVSKSSHRAFYANLKNKQYFKKVLKSNKIDYKKLKKLFNELEIKESIK